ncbi:MAG: GtrA family protein [Bacilli bacterium]|nr:GtrA family protein [Bacilli bacterium]
MKKSNVEKKVDEILKKLNIKLSNDKYNLLVQIFKFFIVGVIATIIDFIIYYICYNKFEIDPLIANIISFSISVIYNYIASVKWVFATDKNKNKKVLFIEFISLSILGLLLTESLLFIFINLLSFNKMISKIIATIITMVFNFVTRKIFIENKNK